MFSSPRADRLRHWLTGWSLRARLIAALVGLLAIVCMIIGVASEVAVHRIELQQLDDNLRASFKQIPPPDRDSHSGPPPRVQQNAGPDSIGGPPVGTLIARRSGTTVTEGWIVEASGERRSLSAAEQDVVLTLPTDGRLYTATLGAHEYRLIARAESGARATITGQPLDQIEDAQYSLAAVETGVSLAALALAALIGALIVRRTLRPLERVTATARRVAELPLDRGEVALSVRVPDVDARTEVGQVGAALNRMLGHVARALAARQASETRVRHFVADASHELRTPLAAIRGYAELTRRFGASVPPDVAHAMSRVESETARMTVLVEDLLLLARLDAGPPLVGVPVDLSRLVIDAVSDAHVAGPNHHWRLDLPAESVTVTGDAARLHQVLANLLANARTHTPPGTTVVTSLRLRGTAVALDVVDDGPGIPPDLLPEVFDRFARGDTSRSRAAGSTGLGLSIVAAVVSAHGGTVEVTSGPGRTAFTVWLPAEVPDGRREVLSAQPAHSDDT